MKADYSQGMRTRAAIFVKTGAGLQEGGSMENKGLCSTCVYDLECAFERIFPVVECEEFCDINPETKEGDIKTRLSSHGENC